MMNLQIIGCSHHQTSVQLRERIAFTAQQVPEALSRFRLQFPDTEAVLLSTCNRTELYTAADDPAAVPTHAALADFLAEFHGLSAKELFDELFSRSGEEAVRHLFMVAASLDSMVVGEAQILSQVKEAYRLAADENSAGQLTHSAFQAALHVAKRVTTETSMHQHRVSIPSVAVRDFACQIFERLDDKKVLVIGAGEMGEETLEYLIDAKARDVLVVNRDMAKATALAEKFNGRTLRWEQLDDALVEADLVISTTAATEPIVTMQRFELIESRRYQRTLFVLDLAVPRDFDAQISECLGVYLYSLDDLQQTCEANRKSRESEFPRATKIVEEESARFMSDLRHRATGPTIQRLKANADQVKQAELQRLLAKLENVDDHGRQEIKYAFDRLVNKLLHPPLESLREERSDHVHETLLDSLKRLFQLKD